MVVQKQTSKVARWLLVCALAWIPANGALAAELQVDLGDWCDDRPVVCQAIAQAVETSNLSATIPESHHPEVVERHTQLLVAAGLGQMGLDDEAHRIFNVWLSRARFREHAQSLITVAGALYDAGYWDDADAAVAQALAIIAGRPLRDRSSVLDALAETYVRIGRWRAIKDLFATQPDWINPDVRLAMAEGMVEEGALDDALAVARNISYLTHRLAALSHVAVAMVAAGRGQEAEPLVAEMMAVFPEFDDGFLRHKYIGPVIDGLAAVEDWQVALEIARGETDDKSRFVALIALAEAQSAAGLLEDALSTLEGAASEAVAGTHGGRGEFLDTIAALGRIGHGEDVLVFVRDYDDAELRDDALARIVEGTATAGDWRIAGVALESIGDATTRATAATVLGRALAAADMPDEAAAAFAAARDAIVGLDSVASRRRELPDIAVAQIEAGFIEEGIATGTMIEPDGSSVHSHVAKYAAIALAQAGRWDEAMALMADMSDAGFRYNDVIEGVTAARVDAAVSAFDG